MAGPRVSRLCLLLALSYVSAVGQQQRESLPIAAGDLVHVSVFDAPELDQRVRVTDDGDVKLALVGAVKVKGLTPADASDRIGDALRMRGLIRHPEVNLLVEQSGVQKVSVLGQVQHPGSYTIATETDLMDVLSLAGGVTPLADVHIAVRRGDSDQVVHAVLPNDPDLAIEHSVKVLPGDLVLVPKAGIVYVTGDVNRAGGFVMQEDGKLTALEAISLAAGTTKSAAPDHAVLVRADRAGVPQIMNLRLAAMQKGKIPATQLQPGDVIYVPFSPARNLLLSASAILSSTSGAAVYAAR